MNLHYQVHLDEFKLCPHCGEKFFQISPEEFQYHRRKCNGSFLNRPIKAYQCDYCEKIVYRRERFLAHIRKEHTFEVRLKKMLNVPTFNVDDFSETLQVHRRRMWSTILWENSFEKTSSTTWNWGKVSLWKVWKGEEVFSLWRVESTNCIKSLQLYLQKYLLLRHQNFCYRNERPVDFVQTFELEYVWINFAVFCLKWFFNRYYLENTIKFLNRKDIFCWKDQLKEFQWQKCFLRKLRLLQVFPETVSLMSC